MARHRMSVRRRIARVVRRVVLTLASIGAAFVALFVWFLVDTAGTPAPVPTSTTDTTITSAPVIVPADPNIVSIAYATNGPGEMIVYKDGSFKVTGNCIPADDDFFFPCADVTDAGVDFEYSEDDPEWNCHRMGNRTCGTEQ